MKRVVTVLLSILLLVGGSVYAPQPGQSQPARGISPKMVITDPSKACQFSFNTLAVVAGYVPVPGNNTVLVDTTPNFPFDTDVVLFFSAETGVSAVGTQLDIAWSLDGGPFVVKGPEFFAANRGKLETKTQMVIWDAVSSDPAVNPHSFTVGWRKTGSGTAGVFFRCLRAEL